MKLKEIGPGIQIPENSWNKDAIELLSPEILKLLANLHRNFQRRREQLLAMRKVRQHHFDQGKLPEYLDKNSVVATSNWKIKNIPQDLLKRRVEITGPVNDSKMVINMLSRNDQGARADTAMLDFEDSMKPSWNNVLSGVKNVIGAAKRELSATKLDENGIVIKEYRLDPNDMALMMVRVRGLHLKEENILIDGSPISAGIFDLAVCFHHCFKEFKKFGQTPKYYVPKCEHHMEARWWNDLFTSLENTFAVETGTIRATFLIETLPAAFQVEEILYEIRDHAAGLNVGRWDKIFSDIKVLAKHPSRVTSDRKNIGMNKYWMDNYAKRLIKICHERGAMAIGGMSAFTPGSNADIRKAQTDKVRNDKQNEASIGHDGCWVSHPYFIGVALEAFKTDNQLSKMLPEFNKYPDLIMKGEGPRTMEGLRTNIRVGIAYMQGWNNDLGCVSWNNLMEDLATLEISRAQTWQWIYHNVLLEEGSYVTKELVSQLFAEELKVIINDVTKTSPENMKQKMVDEFTQAKTDAEKLFLRDRLADFLSDSYESNRKSNSNCSTMPPIAL